MGRRDEIPFDSEEGIVDMVEYTRQEKKRVSDARSRRLQNLRFIHRFKDQKPDVLHHLSPPLQGLMGTDGPLPLRRRRPRGR